MEHFDDFEDPRMGPGKRHQLLDIISIDLLPEF